jgi:hypothetical protein
MTQMRNIASLLKAVFAQMAELVDASDSKSGIRKDVQVRFLFWALIKIIMHCKLLDCDALFFLGYVDRDIWVH